MRVWRSGLERSPHKRKLKCSNPIFLNGKQEDRISECEAEIQIYTGLRKCSSSVRSSHDEGYGIGQDCLMALFNYRVFLRPKFNKYFIKTIRG